MIHALYASQQALKDYREACYHERLNIMTRYFEETLPVVVSEMERKLREAEHGTAPATNP
jgi:hypothetical protein